jgi:hypothetical protein
MNHWIWLIICRWDFVSSKFTGEMFICFLFKIVKLYVWESHHCHILWRFLCHIIFFPVFQQRLSNAPLLIHVSDYIITQICRNRPYSISDFLLYHFDCENVIKWKWRSQQTLTIMVLTTTIKIHPSDIFIVV